MKPKAKTIKRRQRGSTKGGITTTSISFRTPIIAGLKEHDLVQKDKLSVSWLVNQLATEFLEGKITISPSVP